MKYLILYYTSCFLMISTVCCNGGRNTDTSTVEQPHATTQSDDFLIKSGQAGDFIIGQRIPNEDIYKGYKVDRQLNSHDTEEVPEQETVFIISKNGKEYLILHPSVTDTTTIGEIIIYSDEYQTPEGIGVNTTMNDFINTYPDYKLWYTYVSDRYVLETPQYPSVQFLLRKEDYHGDVIDINSDIIPLQIVDFESDTSIKIIRIYQ